jgi:NADH:ubiquinone reductase (H+-translocating)
MSDIASRAPPLSADDNPTDAQPRSEAAAVAALPERKPRIVIVGGGFGGVAAARALRKSDAEVVLIDRRNHHIFQPLLYQVATATLAPSEVAAPIRQLAEKQKNLSVMMGEVTNVDLNSRTVEVDCPGLKVRKIAFDYLVLAAGMRPSYFGHDEFAEHAPGLKTLSDAEAIRAKILSAYETAELTDDPGERARQMTFVLVGAGPTGVELAGSIALMATVTLRSNFRRIDPAKTSILLLEGGQRILPSYTESLAKKAAGRLEKLGVKVMTGAMVEHVDEQGVIVAGKRIESATVLWTAGVAPSPILGTLGADRDRAGRVRVGPFLNLPDNPAVFVIGDAAAATQGGRTLPGVAQVAIQQGRYVGHFISAVLNGRPNPRPFRYFDKGSMAVVGENFAILESGRIRLSGFLTFWIWALLHVMSLPQLQNRRRVWTQWAWTYFTGQRSSRIIPEGPPRG